MKDDVRSADFISATAVAILAGLGFVDFQRAPAHFLAVEFLDGRRAFFLGRHLDKAKAARATGFTIFNQGYAFDCARLREHCLEIAARRVEREISDIKFHSHRFITFSPLRGLSPGSLLHWRVNRSPVFLRGLPNLPGNYIPMPPPMPPDTSPGL